MGLSASATLAGLLAFLAPLGALLAVVAYLLFGGRKVRDRLLGYRLGCPTLRQKSVDLSELE